MLPKLPKLQLRRLSIYFYFASSWLHCIRFEEYGNDGLSSQIKTEKKTLYSCPLGYDVFRTNYPTTDLTTDNSR